MIKLNDRSGFTLAELLIVVAIIGVLSGIAIPVFSTQLEKSREAADLANVRSAYAIVVTAEITGDTTVSRESAGAYYLDVPLRQKQDDWQMALPITLGGVSSTDTEHWRGTPRAGGCCKIKIVSGEVYLYWNGNALATVAGDDGFRMDYFWYRSGSGNEQYLSRLPRDGGRADTKNSVAPIVLNKGDSFSVSIKSALKKGQEGPVCGIFAFYLAEREPEADEKYKAIVDSGWLTEEHFKNGFNPVKNYVNDPTNYYTFDTKGDRITFTITAEEGVTLIVNNNSYENSAMMLNDVIIDRAG